VGGGGGTRGKETAAIGEDDVRTVKLETAIVLCAYEEEEEDDEEDEKEGMIWEEEKEKEKKEKEKDEEEKRKWREW